MTSYSAPQCLTCQYYKGAPPAPGERAKCAVKEKGIPEKIYWKAGKCSSYKMNEAFKLTDEKLQKLRERLL